MNSLIEDDFDLELWKSTTILLLTRIFGEENAYSKEINNLKADYSSWSLRDATANYNPKEACKKAGQEILELAIAELSLKQHQAKSNENITTSF